MEPIAKNGGPAADDARFDPSEWMGCGPSSVRLSHGDITNESVQGVFRALNPEASHRVLSIAGTGCIPIALAWRGAQVDAFDVHEQAIDLCTKRLALVISGDLDGFIKIGDICRLKTSLIRHDFFAYEAGTPCTPLRVEISRGDITQLDQKRYSDQYDRAWFSNALGYGCNGPINPEMLLAVARVLKPGAIAYFANGPEITHALSELNSSGIRLFQQDPWLTHCANFHENEKNEFPEAQEWEPLVLRRMRS